MVLSFRFCSSVIVLADLALYFWITSPNLDICPSIFESHPDYWEAKVRKKALTEEDAAGEEDLVLRRLGKLLLKKQKCGSGQCSQSSWRRVDQHPSPERRKFASYCSQVTLVHLRQSHITFREIEPRQCTVNQRCLWRAPLRDRR